MSLYKYYHPDSFDFICTEDGISVRFSQPAVLNDIFEMNGAQSLDSMEDILKILKTLKIDLFDEIFENYKVYHPYMLGLFANELDKSINSALFEKELVGILSLSLNGNSRTMWSYYSDSHRGFMIDLNIEGKENTEFDFFNFPNLGSPIKYSNKRPINSYFEHLKGTSNNFKNFHLFTELVLTKDEDWKNEEEYRVIANIDSIPDTDNMALDKKQYVVSADSLDQNGFPIHCATIPKDKIRGIYLGARASDALERKARFWIQKHSIHTKLYKSSPCKHNYEMIYKELAV